MNELWMNLKFNCNGIAFNNLMKLFDTCIYI